VVASDGAAAGEGGLHADEGANASAQASPARGEKLVEARCAVCHKGGEQGPPLDGVVGRMVARRRGYAYSSALRSRDASRWDAATLDMFLKDPLAFAPGTRMPIALPDPQERADVIAYLATRPSKTDDRTAVPLASVAPPPAPPGAQAIDTSDATGSNEEMRETMKREACKVGGVLLVAPKEPGKTDPRVALLIIRPVAPDENADLRLMCAGPPDPLDKNDDFDPDQTRVIAAEAFSMRLTSPRWRGWLYEMREELHGAADTGSVWRAKAAELRAARKDCWFAGALEAR
jgi:cytochrome c2